MECHIYKRDPSESETFKLAKEFDQQLVDSIREVMGKPSLQRW